MTGAQTREYDGREAVLEGLEEFYAVQGPSRYTKGDGFVELGNAPRPRRRCTAQKSPIGPNGGVFAIGASAQSLDSRATGGSERSPSRAPRARRRPSRAEPRRGLVKSARRRTS